MNSLIFYKKISSQIKIYNFKIIFKFIFFIRKKINKYTFKLTYGKISFNDILKKNEIPKIRNNISWLGPNLSKLPDNQNREKIKKDYLDIEKFLNNYNTIRYKEFTFFDQIRINFDYRDIWEHDRFHFLTKITKYFLISYDFNSVNKANEYILNFFNKYNYGYSLSWVDGLQLSIRVYSMSYFFFNCKQALTSLEKDNFLRILKLHEVALKKQLEPFYEIQNNHIIGELCGMITLNIIYGSENKIKKYYELLIVKLKNITYEDGLLYEGSMGYNRFVLDYLNFTFILLKQNKISNIKLSKIINYIYLMSISLFKLTDKNNFIPELGDADYGRLYKIDDEDYFCINETLKVSSTILKIKLFNDDNIKGMSYWLCGNFEKNNSNMKVPYSENIEKLNSNVLIYNKSKVQIYFEFSPTGLGKKGYGGHGHNDTGSQLIKFRGKYILDDLGNPSYFNQKKILRNYYRSSRVHNTISRSTEEHSKFLGKYLISPSTQSDFIKYREIGANKFAILGRFQINNRQDIVIRRTLILDDSKKIKIYNLDKYISKEKKIPQLTLILPISSKLINNKISIDNSIIINFDKSLSILKRKAFKYISPSKRVPVNRYKILNFNSSFKARWDINILK